MLEIGFKKVTSEWAIGNYYTLMINFNTDITVFKHQTVIEKSELKSIQDAIHSLLIDLNNELNNSK